MNNFNKKLNELLSLTTNENVKKECQKILEFSNVSSYDLNTLSVRENFINTLTKIDSLDETTERFIKKHNTRILLEKFNLQDIFSLIYESTDLNEIKPYIDYNINNLYSIYKTNSNSFYVAESLYSMLKPYDYIPSLSNELIKLEETFKHYNEEIVVLSAVNDITSLNDNFYNEISEKLDDYFYNISNNNRNGLISYLNAYNYEPTVNGIIEKLSFFIDKNDVFLNNNNPDFIVENVYSFVSINEGNSTFYSNGNFYERSKNDIRVLSNAEVIMLPENYKIINKYIQSDNIIVEQGIISFNFGNTNVKFKVSNVNECFIDGKLIEGNPYQYIVQNGMFDYSIYEHVSILNLIWENLDTLVNIDFAKKIKSKQYSDSISSVLMKINEKMYVNLTNKFDNKNVILSELNVLQARNSIYEFMQYDISESLYTYMDDYTSRVGKLKDTQKTINEQINIFNSNLMKINEAISNDSINVTVEVIELKENLELEIRNLKRNYNKVQYDIDNIMTVNNSVDESINTNDMFDFIGDSSVYEFVVNDEVKVKGNGRFGSVTHIDNISGEIGVLLDDGSIENFEASELELIGESSIYEFVVNDEVKIKGTDMSGSIINIDDISGELGVLLDDGSTEEFEASELELIGENFFFQK